MVMFIIQYNYIDIFMQDFLELSYCGILSTFYVVGFCPVGFCPVGFCPYGFCPVGFCPVGFCPGFAETV